MANSAQLAEWDDVEPAETSEEEFDAFDGVNDLGDDDDDEGEEDEVALRTSPRYCTFFWSGTGSGVRAVVS